MRPVGRSAERRGDHRGAVAAADRSEAASRAAGQGAAAGGRVLLAARRRADDGRLSQGCEFVTQSGQGASASPTELPNGAYPDPDPATAHPAQALTGMSQGTTIRNFNLIAGLAKRTRCRPVDLPARPALNRTRRSRLTAALTAAIIVAEPAPVRTMDARARDTRAESPAGSWRCALSARSCTSTWPACWREHPYDVVQVEGIEMAPYVPAAWAAEQPGKPPAHAWSSTTTTPSMCCSSARSSPMSAGRGAGWPPPTRWCSGRSWLATSAASAAWPTVWSPFPMSTRRRCSSLHPGWR